MSEEIPEETGENRVIRDEKGRVVLGGPSLNPKGRPKDTFSLVALLKRELNAVHPKLKKTYAQIFIDKYMDAAIQKGDVAAMKDIINRTDGLPLQNVNHTGDISVSIINYGDKHSIQLPAEELPTSPTEST